MKISRVKIVIIMTVMSLIFITSLLLSYFGIHNRNSIFVLNAGMFWVPLHLWFALGHAR